MKHFITTIALQEHLSAISYRNIEDAAYLENDREFTNPVLIPLKNLAERGEKIRITAIVTNDENSRCERNLKIFQEEVKTLCKEIGFEYDGVEELSVEYAESTMKHLKFFEALIEHIHDGDELIVDITYGNKPTPIVLQLALTFVYLYKENTVVKALTYGEFVHGPDRKGYIYDVSALFYMNSIMAEMTSAKPQDPLGFIKMLLGEGEKDHG